RRPPRPEPVSPTPGQVVYRSAPPNPPRRNDRDSAGTVAPNIPATLPPPSPTAPSSPIGSTHPETSAFSGPVAMSPDSSPRLLAGRQNRTTRVLPNPDNSSASDRPRFRACSTRGRSL